MTANPILLQKKIQSCHRVFCKYAEKVPVNVVVKERIK